jgi:hypothetical protein
VVGSDPVQNEHQGVTGAICVLAQRMTDKSAYF